MTKLIRLGVTLAVDDTVDSKDVKPLLAGLIAERGTELIGENGTSGGRVHWITAEVVHWRESAPPRPRKRGNPNQQELPT